MNPGDLSVRYEYCSVHVADTNACRTEGHAAREDIAYFAVVTANIMSVVSDTKVYLKRFNKHIEKFLNQNIEKRLYKLTSLKEWLFCLIEILYSTISNLTM
jgi:hypothetical protein